MFVKYTFKLTTLLLSVCWLNACVSTTANVDNLWYQKPVLDTEQQWLIIASGYNQQQAAKVAQAELSQRLLTRIQNQTDINQTVINDQSVTSMNNNISTQGANLPLPYPDLIKSSIDDVGLFYGLFRFDKATIFKFIAEQINTHEQAMVVFNRQQQQALPVQCLVNSKKQKTVTQELSELYLIAQLNGNVNAKTMETKVLEQFHLKRQQCLNDARLALKLSGFNLVDQYIKQQVSDWRILGHEQTNNHDAEQLTLTINERTFVRFNQQAIELSANVTLQQNKTILSSFSTTITGYHPTSKNDARLHAEKKLIKVLQQYFEPLI